MEVQRDSMSSAHVGARRGAEVGLQTTPRAPMASVFPTHAVSSWLRHKQLGTGLRDWQHKDLGGHSPYKPTI